VERYVFTLFIKISPRWSFEKQKCNIAINMSSRWDLILKTIELRYNEVKRLFCKQTKSMYLCVKNNSAQKKQTKHLVITFVIAYC
jgi:hypothetical protein